MVFIFNTNPRFPPFLLYVRCKSGVTFIRRSFCGVKMEQIKLVLHGCGHYFKLQEVNNVELDVTLFKRSQMALLGQKILLAI